MPQSQQRCSAGDPGLRSSVVHACVAARETRQQGHRRGKAAEVPATSQQGNACTTAVDGAPLCRCAPHRRAGERPVEARAGVCAAAAAAAAAAAPAPAAQASHAPQRGRGPSRRRAPAAECALSPAHAWYGTRLERVRERRSALPALSAPRAGNPALAQQHAFEQCRPEHVRTTSCAAA